MQTHRDIDGRIHIKNVITGLFQDTFNFSFMCIMIYYIFCILYNINISYLFEHIYDDISTFQGLILFSTYSSGIFLSSAIKIFILSLISTITFLIPVKIYFSLIEFISYVKCKYLS